MQASATASQTAPWEAGDQLFRKRDFRAAAECYAEAAAASEIPAQALSVRLAQCHQQLGDPSAALRWALASVDGGDDFACWQAAAKIARTAAGAVPPAVLATRRAALLGSYTTQSWAPLLELAALRFGVRLELNYECAYGQYRQEILDPGSGFYGSQPELAVLAVHHGELDFEDLSASPEADVVRELRRWTELWDRVGERSQAVIVQHNFATPPDSALGHLAGRLPGSRLAMTLELNRRLAESAAANTGIVDCERLSALAGKWHWFDPRYWHLAKQAVSPEAQPLLARHTAAVIAAMLGLTRKCLVVDLDNTLWGGVIGEDGLAGIRLGHGPEGEAFAAFQEYLLELKRRGILLAACSKNNEADAREVFGKHPGMRLRVDDFAVFAANWRPKPENLTEIARKLGIGLDALVFLDDNPAERQAVRQALPAVEVPPLPRDPAQFVRCLSECLFFETASITSEDARRTEMYQARARAHTAKSESGSLEDFYRSLKMEAAIAPFDEFHLPRIAQLVGKTNQFNLTTRRHPAARLEGFMADPDVVHLCLRLRDRFDDHGLVGVLIAIQSGDVMEIETWLMSCRVIGRTVEAAMLSELCRHAARRGCRELRGVYIPTEKNVLVKDLYPRFGFEAVPGKENCWRYDLSGRGPVRNDFVALVAPWGGAQ